MEFNNATDCARYYLYELLKKKEGEEVSLKEIKEYGRKNSKMELGDSVYAGLLNRESKKIGNGIEKVANRSGYYLYDSKNDISKNPTNTWINDTKNILDKTVEDLKKAISSADLLTSDLNAIAKIRNKIEELEAFSKSL